MPDTTKKGNYTPTVAPQQTIFNANETIIHKYSRCYVINSKHA